MQVDPIKPTLKPSGAKRLKLKYDEALSNVAFDFNLRLHIKLAAKAAADPTNTVLLLVAHGGVVRGSGGALLGGAVQVNPIKPMLKPPGTKQLKLQCDTLLPIFAFKFNLRNYSWTTPCARCTPRRSGSTSS